MVAEQRGTVVAAVAKAGGAVEVQKARLEQVRLQLLADHIKPAEARKQEMVEAARGASAQIVENGKATASALRDLVATWKQSGASARQIMVAQKLGPLVGKLMSTVGKAAGEQGDLHRTGQLSNGSNGLAVQAAITSEQLKHTLGVDLPAILNRMGQGKGQPAESADQVIRPVPPPPPPPRGS